MRASVYLLVSTALFLATQTAGAQDASSQAMPCVEVQIGQDRAASQMNCINEALKRAVEHEHNAPQPEAPITAQSASNKVGVYNDAAARQMMGNAFGVSAQPQRPTVSFPAPLGH
jgi:hypothetical protein